MINVVGSFCSLFEGKNGAVFVLLIKQLNSLLMTLKLKLFTSLHFCYKKCCSIYNHNFSCKVGGYCR